ncbi:MAG: hypothetical protein HY680_07960 [Chloroflexi bacterium]|nr:hypothetical protein [Chloroflexota bacterium]
MQQLPMYESDTLPKLQQLSSALSSGDYLVFYSNRTYGSITRQPDRYPYSASYYRLLFGGALGYELDHAFASYPHLLGVTFADDPFSRAGVARPAGLERFTPGGLVLDLGYADENVIDYDHPLVLVFRNTGRLSANEIQARINQGALVTGGQADPLALTPHESQVQQAGGTWTGIVREEAWANRLPVLAWLLLVETAFLAAWPLAFAVFRGLHDRGYLLAKALALLLLAYIPWLLAALKLLPFGRPSIFLGLLAVAAASAFILARNSGEAQRFLRARWRGLLFQEALFLAAFAAFLLVRWANPDLWHPFRGGEKPMDLAYLTAVVRSSTVPPYDPWFAGGYLNYYYFGQFIVATLVKATGILPEIAYNLAVPLLFALTVGGAFSVAYNLTHVLRDARTQGKGPGWGPAAAGVAAALMVAVLGNMGGVIQLVRTVWYGWLATARPPGDGFHIWFWVSAHEMMPGQISITEFPLWTFLFADLHAHLIAIPFGVLAIGLALNLVGIGAYGQAGRRTYGQSGRRAVGQWLRGMGRLALPLGFLALAVGALAAINTWDYPTYLLLGAAAVAIAVWSAHRGRRAGGEASEAPTPASHPSEADPGVREGGPPPRHGPLLAHAWTWAVGGILLLATLSFLLFLPYHARNIAYDAGVHTSAQQTNLLHYLALHALFLFILVSFLLYEGRGPIRGWLRGVRRPPLPPPPWDAPQAAVRQGGGRPLLVGLGLLALLTAYLLAAGYATLAVLFLLAVATVLLAARIAAWPGQDAPHRLFLLSLILLALGIGIGVDLVTINNDIDRMNTVFKFYLQAWVLFGLASGVALWRLLAAMRFSWRGLLGAKENWFGILFVLLMAPAVAHTAVALGVVYSAVAPGEAPKWSEGFTLARQGWVLYLPAGLAVLGYVASAVAPSWHRPAWGKGIWLGVLLLLLAGATGYLVPALRVRLAERFSTAFQGLDGAEYMRSVTYNDANGPIDLRWDWEGIQWLRAKVDGSPVVAEGNTDPHNYRWGSRVSIYTGLPTIVGWGWHQTQQRMGEQAEVAARLKDVRALFTTRDVALALDILDRYNVRYIYVGQLERLYYPAEGLAKFDNMAGQGVTLVYPNPGVKIYEVRRE